MNEQKSHKDVLQALDAISKNSAAALYIPSLGRTVNFRPIDVRQQKEILQTAIDNPVLKTKFILATSAIIIENCLDKSVIDLLDVIDYNAILLQLRVMSNGTNYIDNDYPEVVADLSSATDNAKSAVPLAPLVVGETIVVTIIPPKFTVQLGLEKQRQETNQNNDNVINVAIGNAFIGEVLKHIDSVVIKQGNTIIDTEFSKLSFEKKTEIIEKLPVSVAKDIVNYMEKNVATINKMLTFKGTHNTTKVVTDIEVDINAAFFAVK